MQNNLIPRFIGFLNKYKRFIRFGTVGVINTGVDFAVFTLLKSFFGLSNDISQIAGYSAGILNSFVMNKIWTFENAEVNKKTPWQLVKFIAVNIASLEVTLAGLNLLNTRMGLNVYLAKAVVTVAAQVINFLGYKLWVFRK